LCSRGEMISSRDTQNTTNTIAQPHPDRSVQLIIAATAQPQSVLCEEGEKCGVTLFVEPQKCRKYYAVCIGCASV
jgi:hypothetical protein